MTEERALELAASAWCHPTTAYKAMDVELAKAFAVILRAEVDRAEKAAARRLAKGECGNPFYRKG